MNEGARGTVVLLTVVAVVALIAWWTGRKTTLFRRIFCRHHAYLEDLRRIDGDLVTAQCYKCGRVFVGSYGLGFPVQWERRP